MTIAALAPFRTPAAAPADDEDFATLYRQYQPQLVRYVTHHFGSRDAEEITQEALTRALRSLERERSDAETWAWLIRVARNVAHDIARSRRICDTTDDDTVLAEEFADDAELPEPAALLDERRRLVRRALKSLPATQRRILVLYEVDELPCPAIARLVGSNEYAVRKALQRARSRFAAEFRALGGASFGSFGFWFRGLTRRASRGLPAATASTAVCAIAGTLAIGVTAQQAPRLDLAPGVTARVAASAPEAATPAARAAAVAARAAENGAARAGRSQGRPQVAPGPDAGTPDLVPPVPVHVPGPFRPGFHEKRKLAVDTPIMRVELIEYEMRRDHQAGVICSLKQVDCGDDDD